MIALALADLLDYSAMVDPSMKLDVTRVAPV